MHAQFRARTTALPLITTICALACPLGPARSEAADFSGNATLTSDYTVTSSAGT